VDAVRLAGTAPLDDGSRLTWTLAEGRRGRRWRVSTTRSDGRLAQSILLEVTPDGRPAKLELATPAGLLTVHPDPADGRLHGNIVRPTGVEHVSVPWSPDHLLVVAGSPITAAVAARSLEDRIGVGEGESVAAVEVRPDLGLRTATWHAARFARNRWHLGPAGTDEGVTVELDAHGVPGGYAGEQAWPLEATAGE